MHPAWAPDGSAIAVSGEGTGFLDVNSIWVIPLGGGNPVRLSTEQGYFPRYSPDGTQIVFSSERDGNRQVYAIGANGGNERRLITSDDSDDMPDWGYLVAGELGDLSGDGTVDEADIVPFLAYLGGVGDAPSGLANGDLNCDTNRDARDVLRLLVYLAGVSPRPDVCVT